MEAMTKQGKSQIPNLYDKTDTLLEFFFQEQSYSSLHSVRSLAWDHVRGDIDDPCDAIADFCGVIADPWGDRRPPIVARLAKHHKTLLNIVKHHETHVKHCDTSWTTSKTSRNTLKTLWNTQTLIIRCDDIGARCGDVGARCGYVGARRGDRVVLRAISARSFRRWYNSADV